MKFKTADVQRRWLEGHIHGKLQTLANDVVAVLAELYGVEPTMTESSRTRAETCAAYNDPQAPVSPHESIPLRAFDLRSRDDHGNEYPWVGELVRTINIRWTYDPARPEKKCAKYHNVAGSHLHFQVCDNTVFRGTA